MESLEILHLSDFHIGKFRYEDPASLAIKIADILDDNGRKVDVVIVSGDIFDGRSNDSDETKNRNIAISFFRKLIEQFKNKDISSSEFDENSILFVPGNHDLNRDLPNQYKKYDSFIKNFYPEKQSNRITVIDKYNFICDFPDKKIAILGFNSCKIEVDKIKEDDLKWIKEIDFSKFKTKEDEIKEIIKNYKLKESKWDDYGYIDPSEMDNVFTTLRKEIPSHNDYNLVATFHHHFYPFPEIVSKYPDASFIRNYTDVLDKFQKFKIQLVLHGHKHMSIQRAITDNKYFSNPESIIYVLSAGSIGYKDVDNPSFQWLRVYDKNCPKLVDGDKYDFKLLELENVKPITLPPSKQEEKGNSIRLLDALQTEDSKLFIEYKKITDDFEQTIQDSGIEKIIDIIGSLLTIFKDIEIELRKNPKITYILLLALNYRIIFLKNSQSKNEELPELLDRLKNAMLKALDENSFAESLITFLSSKINTEIDKNYHSIIKHVSNTNKRFSAYTSIGLFFTDLFLNISQYGEYYFDKENLKHKINIKLAKHTFYKNIPNDSITLEGNVDRRAIILNFKCKDPTVHKVAVLIVKDFEMRLNKFEESLKEIKLKLYYILPKVESSKYDLENFHFDAYIPTLLPLLTGDNLYKQKEVFIRELVQNCIDATLLRKKLQPKSEFSTDINIELGTEVRGNKAVKYFKIKDNGIGMSKFTVERYFTSIGRSFYVSDEFEELKKDKSIKYDAISNFGIGFLSSFMVCKEVLVKTKNIFESNNNGLEIEIPNYEGCFFIKNVELDNFGTEITLYEDHRKLFNFKKFEEYIKNVLLGLPLTINVNFKEDYTKNFVVESYKTHRDMLSSLQNDEELIFYIPFSEESKDVKELLWEDLISSNINTLDKYGISFNFNHLNDKSTINKHIITSNQGLKISTIHLPLKLNDNYGFPMINVNYPSSFIQLDVSREKVVGTKDNVSFNNILPYLNTQILNYLNSNNKSLLKVNLSQINSLNNTLKGAFKNISIDQECFTLKINKNNNGLDFTIIKIKDLPIDFDDSKVSFSRSMNKGSHFKLLLLVYQTLIPFIREIRESSNIEKINLKTNKKIEKTIGKEIRLLRENAHFISNTLLKIKQTQINNDSLFSLNIGNESIGNEKTLMELASKKIGDPINLLEIEHIFNIVEEILSFRRFTRNQDAFKGKYEVLNFEQIDKLKDVRIIFINFIMSSILDYPDLITFLFTLSPKIFSIETKIFNETNIDNYKLFKLSIDTDDLQKKFEELIA